ncbi:50S ribosomal protein L25 [Candidatus Gracilibacteria bacterium]|nr:50S ribosomal protein L25 [Candidatus Gracilibacteria bacterium]
MEKLKLSSEVRDLSEKLSTIRGNKLIPGVVYGHKFPSKGIQVGYSDFLKTFRTGGHTHIVELTIDGKKHDVLIHEVQKHPVTGDFQHVDFMALAAGEKIHVKIPLVLVGSAPATREGGLVSQSVHEVEVKCFPKDLVDSIEIDISGLTEIGSSIHLVDVKIDSKFEILTHLDLPVVTILETKAEKEEVIETSVADVETTEQKETTETKEEEK